MTLPATNQRHRLRAGAAALCAGVALLALVGAAQAQQSTLRGEASENDINRQVLLGPIERQERAANQRPPAPPAPVYRTEAEQAEAEAEEAEASGQAGAQNSQVDGAQNAPVRRPRSSADREAPVDPVAVARERKARLAAAAEAKDEADAAARAPVERQPRLDSEDDERNIRAPAEGATGAIERIERQAEENPYAPLGMRLGTFNVITTLEQGLTATDNANYSSVPKGAVLSESALRLNAASDWSRHSAQINAYGTYRRSVSGEEVDEPSAGIDGQFNLDIDHELRGIGKFGYNIRRETADSPVVLPANVSRPLRHNLTGSVAIEKDVGKMRFSATAGLDRLSFGDAASPLGPVSQEERNQTLFYGKLRGGYEISPALTPFAEVELGRRVYDMRIDSAGFARSADRRGIRGGVELDLSEKLRGELSAGWFTEDFDDPALQDASGLSLNADLRWSPERGTTVGLTASTTVEGTTNAGESGSVMHQARLSLERQIRSNLTANAEVGIGYRDYISQPDNDVLLNAETSLTWWLNRYAGIKGRYRYEQTESSLPNRDSRTNSVYLGVVLQR
ncbi:MAG: outer membrane beta-barrel protein [Mesorhizobium sp.]